MAPPRTIRTPVRPLEEVLASLARLNEALDETTARLDGRPVRKAQRRTEFEDLTPVRSLHRLPPR